MRTMHETGVCQGFHNGKVSIVQLDIFADKSDGYFLVAG